MVLVTLSALAVECLIYVYVPQRSDSTEQRDCKVRPRNGGKGVLQCVHERALTPVNGCERQTKIRGLCTGEESDNDCRAGVRELCDVLQKTWLESRGVGEFREVFYTVKAREARQCPERQYSTHANRKKQCRPNETKPYSNATHPHKRQNNLTNGHT